MLDLDEEFKGNRSSGSSPVTVGLSVYANDRSEWVVEAIESVLQQSFVNFILGIYIDGPVSQELLSLINQFRELDSRIHVFRSESCRGLAHGLNFLLRWGLKERSTYFFRMDSDDICYRERFYRQLEFMEGNPQIDVSGTGLVEFRGAYEVTKDYTQRRLMPIEHDQIVTGLARYSTLNHPTVCFRYSSIATLLIENNEFYKSDCGLAEDYRLWIDLAISGFRFANLSEALLAFRITDDFYRRRSLAKALSEWKVRMHAMRQLGQLTITNICFACGVLLVRTLPIPVIKLAYRYQRQIVDRA